MIPMIPRRDGLGSAAVSAERAADGPEGFDSPPPHQLQINPTLDRLWAAHDAANDPDCRRVLLNKIREITRLK
jgi:hypothetical protein